MAAPPPSKLDANQTLQGAYDDDNGLFRVGISAPVVAGAVEVSIDAATDSIAIKDPSNNNVLAVNNDGSINVVVSTSPPATGIERSLYNEVASVAMGIETTLITYTVPAAVSFYLNRVEVSGENIAMYAVKFNTIVNDKLRTYFGGELNALFNYSNNSGPSGYEVATGTIITVTVLHNRPNVGDFNARMQGIEL